SVTDKKTLQLWDLATGRVVATVGGLTATPVQARFAADGVLWFARPAGGGSEVVLIDPASDAARVVGKTAEPVAPLAVAPDGRAVAVTLGRTLQILDSATGRVLAEHRETGDNSLSCEYMPGGRTLLVVAYQASIDIESPPSEPSLRLWDVARQEFR